MSHHRRSTTTNENKIDDNGDRPISKFEKFYLLVSKQGNYILIFSIIISVLTAYGVAKFEIDNQKTFSKHAAAEQIAFEIKSKYPYLLSYSEFYGNLSDLTSNNANLKVNLSEDTIVYVYDKNHGSAPYVIEFKNGRAIMGAPRFSLLYIDGQTIIATPKTDNPQNPVVEKNATIGMPVLPQRPLYSDHGMYYFYVSDVPYFDNNTAEDIFNFYDKLSTAESEREYISQFLNTNPNSNSSGYYFADYMDMRANIMGATDMIPTLLTELNNETKS